MIKEIVKDALLLTRTAELMTENDRQVIQDLHDTLMAHQSHCVGMAANMIGANKACIMILDQGRPRVLINPVIMKTMGRQIACEEGCLCHVGMRTVMRYEKIRVSYFNEQFQQRIQTFQGFPAQIIQHEMDHLQGILI